jgi:hypothetical protein
MISFTDKTWKEHMKHLKKVLKILRKEKFLVKKMYVWKEGSRILGVHSRKGTSEDGFRKSRNSKQVTSAAKSKKSQRILRISELLSKVYISIHSYNSFTERVIKKRKVVEMG